MPKGPFGDAVKLGENIFRHTTVYAHGVIGNALNCSNCHLDAGRLAGSAPMWAAYTGYPAYRQKNRKVNNFGMRLQGCFRFSENGKVPALDSKTIIALEAYSFWLATNAPTGAHLAGRGYPRLAAPAETPDYARGRIVYREDCSLCHGARGQGQYARGQTVFPPLWGAKSFNWGAGMGSVKNAAEFIYANMPLGAVGTLSVQQAWDVAQYVDSHDRPQDPRFSDSVAATRKAFHDSKFSMYGRTVNGHLLGSNK
ncbi:c-type cytochrome [Acidiphilium sp. C61]|uniref:c-type cytochrome n=1 Tax=Acidiphilium sp. C61 TaxID=1671485 RepID=UPI001EFFF70B|nr:c-type cytochrome [Acidiphilium sp. C61]